MRGRQEADTAPRDTEHDHTTIGSDSPLRRVTTPRLLVYLAVATLPGGAAQQRWTNFLNGYWLGVATTSAMLAVWLVVLALMYRHDRKHGRIGDQS